MVSKLRRILPIFALIGAIMALISLAILSVQRQEILVDTGETTNSVERTITQLQDIHPASIEDSEFKEALSQAQDAPFIAVLWLFTPGGKILEGNQAHSAGRVDEFITNETRRVLAALPAGFLNDEQRVAITAASVMQAEGEHNDVFRHMIREIHAEDGLLVAYLGVTYDVNPSVGTSPSATWILLILSLVLGLGMYWLSLPLWVWLDARARGERQWIWMIFVLIGNLVALMAYILARLPQRREVSKMQKP
jgi:hypothetical protein